MKMKWNENHLHFVPSVEELYWMELEVLDREAVKDLINKVKTYSGSSTNSILHEENCKRM
jgi:hypothetical protein